MESKEPWELTQKEFVQSDIDRLSKISKIPLNIEDGAQSSRQWHKKYVTDAIKQGLPVPAMVLKDYAEVA